MSKFLCKTCGVQYAESEQPPSSCPICEDERQFVPPGGHTWTTLEEMKAGGYSNEIREEEPGLVGISTTPRFAIGQRALLVRTDQGNVLYDCISYIDDETVKTIKGMGGIQAITLSHPHFYDGMVEWSHAFDNAPIYIPEADREWVMRPDPAIQYWDGKPLELVPGVSLLQGGGHFDGSATLHWAAGAGGKGALLVGDTFHVVLDRRFLGFSYSIVNLIPLSPESVQRLVASVEPYDFDRIYGGWWDRTIASGAKDVIRRSMERYIRFVKAG